MVGPVALVVAMALGACTGSGYRYVASSSTGTFFKVPGSWTVFHDARSIVSTQGTASSGSLSQEFPLLVAFDANPRPSIEHDLTTASYPFGVALVRTLTVAERDSFSLATLRNQLVPVDNLIQADPNSVEPVGTPRSIVRRGGLHGTHLVFTVHRTGGASFTVDQIGLVDASTRRVWFLLVGCEASCFTAHRAAITRVADSWTVKES